MITIIVLLLNVSFGAKNKRLGGGGGGLGGGGGGGEFSYMYQNHIFIDSY